MQSPRASLKWQIGFTCLFLAQASVVLAGGFLSPRKFAKQIDPPRGRAILNYSERTLPSDVGPFLGSRAWNYKQVSSATIVVRIIPNEIENDPRKVGIFGEEKKGQVVEFGRNMDQVFDLLEGIFSGSPFKSFFKRYPNVYVEVKKYYVTTHQVLLLIRVDHEAEPYLINEGIAPTVRRVLNLVKMHPSVLSVSPEINVRMR